MRSLIIILLILIALPSQAQRVKYRDIFPIIWEAQEETALMMIKEFLVQEPEHANANYMLAGIYSYRYLSSDILTQHERALANADQSRLRIIKCRLLIDEREVRRNNEYYMDEYGIQMDWSEIDSTLTATSNSAEEFIEKAPPVYENFTQSVLHYDRTIKTYAEICSRYNSLDNLLMLYDAELEEDLNSLKESYDSTLYYFEQYKSLIAEYPIGYNQEITVIPIERFRLQGLVDRVDFLNDEITVWDYSKWVDEVKEQVISTVADIRTKLEQNHKLVKEALDANYGTEAEFESKVDKELVYNLEKLDFQSLPVALLNFKDYLTDLKLNEGKRRYYDTALSLEATSKYIYYSEIINKVRKADTLLQAVQVRNTDEKRAKHAEFLENEYGGGDGLETFIQVQKDQNEKRFSDYILGMRNVIVDNSQTEVTQDSGTFVTFRRKRYPAWITGVPAELSSGELYTTHHKVNPDNSVYVGGVYAKDAEGSSQVSFIYKAQAGKVLWLQEFEIPVDSLNSPTINTLGAMEPTKEGVLLLVNSRNETRAINSLYYLDDAGSEKFVQTLEDISEFPRSIKYYESQNRFLLAFRGSEQQIDVADNQETKIVAFNTVGDYLWDTEVTYSGDIVDIIGVQDGYMLVGNFTAFTDRSGKAYSTSTGNTGSLAIRFNARGNVVSENAIESGTGYYITHVVKASDSNINILGYEGNLSEYDNWGLRYGRDLVHIVLDGFTNVISSSLN